jgi:tetratricopeptide (TPR) repeat protein
MRFRLAFRRFPGFSSAMRWRLELCLAALSGVIVYAPAIAAQDSPFGGPDPYQSCVRAININASDAFELALTWRDRGGGLLAERCAALALIALDEPGEAAARLNALARRPNAGTVAQRASLLVQSGNAWLLAGEPQTAEAAFSAALKMTPRDSETWVDRARARAVLMNWVDAEADLSNALTFDKSKPETYVLRASARQAQGNNAGYRRDIATALALDPNFPEALVERGTINLEDGNVAGARNAWIEVLIRAPDSPAGDAARDRIQALEVHDR